MHRYNIMTYEKYRRYSSTISKVDNVALQSKYIFGFFGLELVFHSAFNSTNLFIFLN